MVYKASEIKRQKIGTVPSHGNYVLQIISEANHGILKTWRRVNIDFKGIWADESEARPEQAV